MPAVLGKLGLPAIQAVLAGAVMSQDIGIARTHGRGFGLIALWALGRVAVAACVDSYVCVR